MLNQVLLFFGATAEWENIKDGTYENFLKEFKAVFHHPNEGRTAADLLMQLQQRTRRFKHFSSVADPLTSRLKWNPQAESVFRELKVGFTTAPLLKHPDPAKPFIVEVDASNVGFDGDPERCRGFLLQCSLVFERQPSRFPTERARVAYIMALLTGRALTWATPLWEQRSDSCSSVAQFSEAMHRTFFNPEGGRAAAPWLLRLRQGARSASDYAIDFRTLGSESGWNEEALMALFHQGLNERLKDELATRDLPSTLEAMDNRLRERERSRATRFRGSPSWPASPVASPWRLPKARMPLNPCS
ncbi:hypothetical protein NFI96_002626 [Prochilodus magdalenae]|nr:hypothetical protein NFI96_002626 [Prochilodus magdalenae]